jgi:hypothetical protein
MFFILIMNGLSLAVLVFLGQFVLGGGIDGIGGIGTNTQSTTTIQKLNGLSLAPHGIGVS